MTASIDVSVIGSNDQSGVIAEKLHNPIEGIRDVADCLLANG